MIRNLFAGFKVAFFLRSAAKDFRISALNFWCIFFLIAGSAIFLDYFEFTRPVRFSTWGLTPPAFYLCLLLFACFLLSLLFRMPELAVSLPVVCLNALCIPLLLGMALHWVVQPAWIQNFRQLRHYRELCGLWLFLIFLRALLLFTGMKARRQIASALLLLAVVIVPGRYLYFGGFWYQDRPEDSEYSNREADIYAEDILQQQDLILNKQLDAILPANKKNKDRQTYVVLFAGFGEQTVFMKEVLSARKLLEDKFHAKGRSVVLINNKATLKQYPLATVANLKNTLNALGHKANTKKDVLLLYLTSHGSKEGTLSVEMNEEVWLRQLNGQALRKLLKDSGFEWKVVIVSSCYSGNFIDAMKEDNTLIMTSSRKDRTSFGCGDEFDMTYFGDAMFKQALPKTTDFIPAFNIARAYIEKRENEENIEPNSEPQIYAGPAIRKYLYPHEVYYGPQPKPH